MNVQRVLVWTFEYFILLSVGILVEKKSSHKKTKKSELQTKSAGNFFLNPNCVRQEENEDEMGARHSKTHLLYTSEEPQKEKQTLSLLSSPRKKETQIESPRTERMEAGERYRFLDSKKPDDFFADIFLIGSKESELFSFSSSICQTKTTSKRAIKFLEFEGQKALIDVVVMPIGNRYFDEVYQKPNGVMAIYSDDDGFDQICHALKKTVPNPCLVFYDIREDEDSGELRQKGEKFAEKKGIEFFIVSELEDLSHDRSPFPPFHFLLMRTPCRAVLYIKRAR